MKDTFAASGTIIPPTDINGITQIDSQYYLG